MLKFCYPLVLLPVEIENLKKQQAQILEQQIESNIPDREKIPLPEIIPVLPIFPSYHERQWKWLFLILCVGWFIGIIGVLIIGLRSFIPWGSVLCFSLAYSGVIYLSLNFIRARLSRLWRTYQYEYQKYCHQLALLEKQKQQQQLSRLVANKQKSDSKADELIQHQQQLRLQLQQLALKRLEPVGKSNALVGVSEKQFGEVLQRCFGSSAKLLQGIEFFVEPIKNPRRKKIRDRTYAADFLLLYRSGLGFDIEIDEPYALLNKYPTHCVDDDKDQQRNQFFVNGGWVVVRFTEEQVVKQPLSCCKVIASVIRDVTGDNLILEQLSQVSDLSPVKPWTVEQAKSLAKIDYRLSYLHESIRLTLNRHKQKNGKSRYRKFA